MSERDPIEFGRGALEHLPLAKAPDTIWPAIEAAAAHQPVPPMRRAPQWRLAIGAVLTVALMGIAFWDIARRAEWIETDAHSRTTLKVGDIGSVEVEPNTRLRVIADRANEHRLALARGEIRAKISAPPKLFFVDTASGTAIDLGCEYTLSDDDLGRGMLSVTRGWVSFQWKGLESLVPAGASCRTRPRLGPGIPYFDDAPEGLKQALDDFDLHHNGTALEGVLKQSRVRDTLTLWHLLQRVDVVDRGRVYERIATLTPIPAGVSRERALRLDPQTLTLWKDELAWKW
jgi:hypothetical protein